MARRCKLLALAVLALSFCLLVPQAGFAQFRFGYGNPGFGGYGGNYGWGNPGFGYGGYGAYGNWVSPYYQGSPYYQSSPYYYQGGQYNQPWAGLSSMPNVYNPQSVYGQPYTAAALGAADGYANRQAYGLVTQALGTGYSGLNPAAYQALIAAAGAKAPADRRRAYIEVRVPDDAEVFFDNTATKQTGANRSFMTPPLEKGTYSFEVSVRWMADGKAHKETRNIRLTPGQTVNVDFRVPEKAPTQSEEKVAPPNDSKK